MKKEKYIAPLIECIKICAENQILAASSTMKLNTDFSIDDIDEEQKDNDIVYGL